MRRPGIWRRAGRPGWYTTIGGRKVYLADDREDAQREFHRLRGDMMSRDGDMMSPTSRHRVADLVALYLVDAHARVRPLSYRLYYGYLTDWSYRFGSIPASSIRPYHIAQWVDAHPGWRSTSTRHNAIGCVKLWSGWCHSQGYTDRDWLAKVKRPPMRSRAPVAGEAIERMIACIKSPRFRDLVTFLQQTGCRPGEARTLEASRIDWEASTATVVGKRGPRVIGLTSGVLAMLRRLALDYPQGVLFRTLKERPWNDNSIQSQVSQCNRRAGTRVTAYQFRHHFWLRLHRAGVDSVVIARQMGHVSLDMLRRHYAHADAAALVGAVEACASKD